MASKDEKNKIKIIQAVLDFHMKDLISTIQMELKKKQYLQSCRGLRLGSLPSWCLLHCLLDERTSAGRRRDDQMNTKCRPIATHAKSPRGLRTCGERRRVRGLELGSDAQAALYYWAYFLRPCNFWGLYGRTGCTPMGTAVGSFGS
jgi:hypothetical protein